MKISRVLPGYELLDDKPAVVTWPATDSLAYRSQIRVDVTVSLIFTRDEFLKVAE